MWKYVIVKKPNASHGDPSPRGVALTGGGRPSQMVTYERLPNRDAASIAAEPGVGTVARHKDETDSSDRRERCRGGQYLESQCSQHPMIGLRGRVAAIDDLVDGLNDMRPRIIHFFGRVDDGLLLDTADPIALSDLLVSYADVTRVLGATNQPICGLETKD